MDTILLGKILAAYLLVSGLGFLLSRDFYRKLRATSETSDRLTVNLSGMVHFILGMAIVTTHHSVGQPAAGSGYLHGNRLRRERLCHDRLPRVDSQVKPGH